MTDPLPPPPPKTSAEIVEALDRAKIAANTGLGRGSIDPADPSYWPQVAGVPQRPGKVDRFDQVT